MIILKNELLFFIIENIMIFKGIEEFVTVVEQGGFSAAAKVLDMSVASISRHIDALEAQLGMRLFNRSTRSMQLTEAGKRYYPHCQALVGMLGEANQDIIEYTATPRGRLRVSMMGGAFAEHEIVPQLLAFMTRYPEIDLELDMSARNVDIIAEGYDLAIRYGVLQDSRLVAQRLLKRRICMAASPDYLQAYGMLQHPDELSRHQCLAGSTDYWRLRFADGYRNIRVKGRLLARDSGHTRVLAAKAGLGIYYGPEYLVKDDLASQALLAILPDYCSDDMGTWLVYSSRDYLPHRLRLLIDFLKANIQLDIA